MAYSNRPAENNKYSSVNLITSFITFDSIASVSQRRQMDGLRLRLHSLSKNPCMDVDERLQLAKEIYNLRCSTDCTVTSDMELFHSE